MSRADAPRIEEPPARLRKGFFVLCLCLTVLVGHALFRNNDDLPTTEAACSDSGTILTGRLGMVMPGSFYDQNVSAHTRVYGWTPSAVCFIPFVVMKHVVALPTVPVAPGNFGQILTTYMLPQSGRKLALALHAYKTDVVVIDPYFYDPSRLREFTAAARAIGLTRETTFSTIYPTHRIYTFGTPEPFDKSLRTIKRNWTRPERCQNAQKTHAAIKVLSRDGR